MAVSVFVETWRGVQGGGSASSGTRTRTFDVVATYTGSSDIVSDIKAHGSCPAVGSAHPYVAGYYATDVQVRENGGPTKFQVTVPYAPRTTPPVPSNPTSANPEVSWGSIEVQEAIDADEDGLQIGTSAGEPFDPPITRPTADLLLDFTKNYATGTVTPAWLLQWAYRTNSNAGTISGVSVAAGEGLIIGVPSARLVPAQEGVSAYYSVNFRIAWRIGQGADAWKRVLLDQGYRTRDGSGKLTTVVDEAGRPLNQPVLLDGSGGRLASGGTPVLRTFRTYKTVSFAGIGLVFP